jgi:large subunit ribosomal protein L29
VSKQKFSELAALSPADLQAQLKAAKEELFNLRFQLAIRQLENTAKIGETKTKIAQLQTALRTQELAAGGTK